MTDDFAPDVSQPGSPSLRKLFGLIAPPGTDGDALLASLKASRMPAIPLGAIPSGPAGTTCAGCQGRGVLTWHSPAGEEHKVWEAMWARDPSWMPDGVTPMPKIPRLGPPCPDCLARGAQRFHVRDDAECRACQRDFDALERDEPDVVVWCHACSRPHPRGLICPEQRELAAKATSGPRWSTGYVCHDCGGRERVTVDAPEPGKRCVICAACGSDGFTPVWDDPAAAYTGPLLEEDEPAELGMPPDPVTPGVMAATAVGVMLDDMLGAGVPLESAERIIGHMLASLVVNAPDEH